MTGLQDEILASLRELGLIESQPEKEDIAGQIRQLFIRYGIAPEPARATRLRRRMYRQLERTTLQGRRPGETDSEFRARISTQRGWYTVRIRRILFDPTNYANWHPSPENWIQLCIVLAHRHGEPGFEVHEPRPNAKLENTFLQDTLIYGLLQSGAKSVAAAASEAAKIIEKERKPEVAPPSWTVWRLS